jgi:hypothetical protein
MPNSQDETNPLGNSQITDENTSDDGFGIKQGNGNPQKHIRAQQKALGLMKQLNTTLIDIDALYQGMFDGQRNEFMMTYQMHMKHIHKEMDMLKQQLDEKYQKRKLDKKIVELSNEVEWFRKEALVLKDQTTKNK